MHALSLDDMRSYAVRPTGACGCLLAPDLPPRVQAWDRAECKNLRTWGDGACALHALFGSTQHGSMMQFRCARGSSSSHASLCEGS